MTDKIILNIQHSDDYTDYLLMTAGLTNKRIIPMVNPSSEKLKAAKNNNSKVIRCFVSRDTLYPWSTPAYYDPDNGTIWVYSRCYLEDDGSINYTRAEIARQTVEEMAMRILMDGDNLREAYRLYFPLLWGKRKTIYDNPKYFFVGCGRDESYIVGDHMPIGAVLKAIEEDPTTFHIRLGGGCSCGKQVLLTDYEDNPGTGWTLYTWCPACGTRREIRTWSFPRFYKCQQSIADAAAYYSKGRAVSPLSLFDLVDELRSA